MFFTKNKLWQRVYELEQKRYFDCEDITPFVAMEGQLSKDESNVYIPDKIEGSAFHLNDNFVGRDRYLWIEKELTLPESKEGSEIVGLFDFGETGAGTNSGFESLMYVNRKHYQGVDTNHKEVFLTQYAGKKTTLTFMLWSGLEGGGEPRIQYHRCKMAKIGYLHKNTDELYFFASVIMETLEYLHETDEHYENLLTALDRALLVVDWDGRGFYESVDEAHQILMTELGRLHKNTDITVNVVGHTHIDVAWLWRLKHTREKAQRSFSTVLRLMEQYDEYIFQQAQPQLYQFMKEDSPELYEKIKERIQQGRWEPDGGMWVEADCNLSSGEALVRQFLHGTRFFEKEFGKKCEYLWLPDVFGYTWALPQILKQCELDTFMTTKISWNQYNTIPDDLFKWKGIDGTEILTYFIDTPEVGDGFEKRYSTYNGLVSPRTIIGSWTKFKNKSLSRDTLISYGYGDGGGGVNRDMLEKRRVMDKLPGLPNVKQTTAGAFFRKMHENVDNTDRYVHIWDGELYLEGHRGTYTTQGYNKKMNRYLENQLVQLEWLSSMAAILGDDYAKEELHDAWECVLLHQFHDIIPGSSIREVYEDSHVNYERTEKKLDVVKSQALRSLVREKEHSYGIYSTNSFEGKELVWIPERKSGYFVDEQGRLLESQRSGAGYEVFVETKPFAIVQLEFHKEEIQPANSAFQLNDNVLETPFYTIVWNEEGNITSIYDKEARRNVLKEGMQGNVLEIYEDKPLILDAWDIDIYHYQKMEKVQMVGQPQLIENGNLKAVIRFHYQYNFSTFVQDMVVYKHSRRVDFKTHVDWNESHKLLKVAFYTDIRTTKATYDIQFGHVERPTHWNTSWDWAKFEVCGHKWADISETGYGVSILNDCKYGHSIRDGVVRLSLLKSPKYPDTTADMGEHDFTYSLYPHHSSCTEGGTIEEANRLNLPAQVVAGEFKKLGNIVKVNSNHVQIDAIKKAEDEDCYIVRMHECRGGSAEVTLTSDYVLQQIVPCNLLEHDTEKAIVADKLTFTVRPFEIKSFKLYIK